MKSIRLSLHIVMVMNKFMNNRVNRMKRHLKYTVLLVVMVAFVSPLRAQNEHPSELIEKQRKQIEDQWRQIMYLRTNIDSLVAKNDQLLSENKMLHVEREHFRHELYEMKSYMCQVEPLVKRQLAEMAMMVDQKWLNKTFAEINKDELMDELVQYKAFKDKDKGVETAYNKLSEFYDEFLLYLRGVEVVNSPYQADSVVRLIKPMKELTERETHMGRRLEMGTLYTQLNDYKVTVMYCQEEIIGNIDKMQDGFKRDGTDKMAWKQIKHFLDTKDDGKVETYMSEIPWLAEQYHEYLKQLEANPYGFNTARETIMKLIP